MQRQAIRNFQTSVTNNKEGISKIFQNTKLKRQQILEDKSKKSLISNNFIPYFDNKVTYDPFDFSLAKLRYQKKINKVKSNEFVKSSNFNSVEINPLDFYCLPHLLSNFLNLSGQILHRSVTGLESKNQKKISKAIKRSRSFGLLSSVSKDVSTFPKRGSSL